MKMFVKILLGVIIATVILALLAGCAFVGTLVGLVKLISDGVTDYNGDFGAGKIVYSGDFDFVDLDSGEGMVLYRYDGKEENLVIPDNVNGEKVIGIDSSAFYYRRLLSDVYTDSCPKTLYIPEGVTKIHERTFKNCEKLESIEVSDENSTYSSIDGNLYSKDAKTFIRYASSQPARTFTIPDHVETISNYAFERCRYTIVVTVPESVGHINPNSFADTGEIQKIINRSSEYIRMNYENDPLNDYIEESFKVIEDKDGKLTCVDEKYKATEDGFIFEEVEGTWWLIAYVGNEDTVIISPDIYEEKFVIHGLSGIVNAVISGEISHIDSYAFEESRWLGSVKLEEGVETIGNRAFDRCENLKSVILPSSIKSISDGAFASCISLSQIELKDGITNIGTYAFRGCSALEAINIPSTVTSIGECAFYGCKSLTEVTLSDGLKEISWDTFANCEKLTLIVIGESVEKIYTDAFYEIDPTHRLLYKGTKEMWESIIKVGADAEPIKEPYYYSEFEPVEDGRFWHYDAEGRAVLWGAEISDNEQNQEN